MEKLKRRIKFFLKYILCVGCIILLMNVIFKYFKVFDKNYIDKIQSITIAKITNLKIPSSSVELHNSDIMIIKNELGNVEFSYLPTKRVKSKTPYIVGTARISDAPSFTFTVTNEGYIYITVLTKNIFPSLDIYKGKLSQVCIDILEKNILNDEKHAEH